MAARGIGYTMYEDVVLAESYLQISQDPIVGKNQSNDRFWERIEEVYHERLGSNYERRTIRSLQSRMSSISIEIKKLNACLRQIEYTRPSGKLAEDIVRLTTLCFIFFIMKPISYSLFFFS